MHRKRLAIQNKIVPCLLVTGITFLLIVLFEVVLGVLGFGHDMPFALKSRYDKFRPDKGLVWALKKDWNGLELNGAPVTTDSYGLRRSGNDAEGNYKVLFLGDSVTYGHFLGDLQAIPAILEAVINKKYAHPEVRVFNGGVPGYSTFQSVGSYQSLSPQLKPDLVLLGFCLNDVTERYLSMSEYGGNRFSWSMLIPPIIWAL